MKRNRFGTALIVGGIICLAAAAALVGGNLWTERKADDSAQQALAALKSAVDVSGPQQDSFKESETAATEPLEIPDHILNPDMDMPERVIDGLAYIGYLEFPSLDLELPVITETTYPNLRISPCRYEGSAYLDNLVIGAHNYARHFGKIGKLAYGDEINFTDMDGNVFRYLVADIEILQPDQVEELCSGEWPLSLYTCTIGGRTRVTVRCERIEE